jgi:hypothetical protein
MDNVEALRKLKFVYCFIKAAEDPVFQEVQKKCAEKWLDQILKYSIRGKIIKDYITSEHGIALLLDISVFRGKYIKYIVDVVNQVINKVLDKNIADTPANWNDNAESEIIKALIDIRIIKMGKDDADKRIKNINEANLNKKRNSFK